MLLENRNKSIGFVNGQICSVHSMEGPTIIAQHPQGHFINVFPVTCPESGNIYYPLRPAYSRTIAKVQGQAIPQVIIWIDYVTAPPGTLYVALS